MKPLRFFLTEYEDEMYAFTEETLKEFAEEGESIEEAAARVGEGTWCEVHLHKPTFRHQQEAENLITEINEQTGQIRRNPTRLPGARVQVLVERWTIPGIVPDEAGFNSLAPMVAQIVDEYVASRMYPVAVRHPAFFDAWKRKQERLQAEASA